ncbi:MAG: hypothetical protein QM516_03850 [Limnohabitans sp.]|nr:hypothetical protein [Limnohabitans sp.]
MSKKKRKKKSELETTTDVAPDASMATESTLSKKERKAAAKAEKAAEKAAGKSAEKQDASADAAPATPKFKHLRKKKLTSGKGASPREVGESLVALFNAGKADEAEKTWYHRKIESIEGDGSVFEGLKGVAEKSAWWCSENKIVAAKAEGPFACSTGFTVIFTMTIDRADGTRMEFREAGVYTVEKGRIVREQFMYEV